MTNNLLILPLITPLAAALLMFVLRHIGVLRAVNIFSASIQLGTSVLLLQSVQLEGTKVLNLGNWGAPFGIVFVGDLLSISLVLITAIVAFAAALYAPFATGDSAHQPRTLAFLQLTLTGVYGAFLTGDLFNLFVWFEVMLISSFVLLSLGSTKQVIGGAFKYVILNVVSSVLFLTAVGLIYGKLGTLNFAHLAVRVGHLSSEPMLSGAAVLLFGAFSIKAALFPVFFWLPASYHNAPPLISAVFGGLLTKVGVYALLRTFTLVFPLHDTWLQATLLALSLLTMIVGVLGAAAQTHFRRILSFHIVSQIGYMTLGLALYTPVAIAGAMFYLLHHIVAKTNLFLFGGLAAGLCGSENIREQGGLFTSNTKTALLFLVPALSLAGIPPLSGFFAKLLVLKAAIDSGAIVSATVALAVGILTLYSMSKLWNEAFWKPLPTSANGNTQSRSLPLGTYLSVSFLGLTTLSIGLGAHEVYQICEQAAAELMHRDSYINAVLGGS